MLHLPLHLPLLRAVFWRTDDNRIGNRCQGVFDFVFIQAVRVREHAGWRQSQEIGACNEFRHRCVKDRDQVRVVNRRHFIMPPALGDEGYLTGRYLEVQQLLRERIDHGDDGCAGNDIHQLGCILVDMRLHHIACAEVNIQQGGVSERVQFFYGERIDEILIVFLECLIVSQIISITNRWRGEIYIRDCHCDSCPS